MEPYLSTGLGRRGIEACKGRSTHCQDDEWQRWAAGFGHHFHCAYYGCGTRQPTGGYQMLHQAVSWNRCAVR